MRKALYTTVTKIDELQVQKVNMAHIALAYRMQLLNAKPRTAKTKRIGELAYSGRKLFRQKGTGYARQGERGNPHMRGGYVPMGPLPNDRSIKINRKVRRSALHSAIKYHLDSGAIKVLNLEEFENYTKTKDAYSTLVKSGFSGRGILVIPKGAVVERAVRNIAGITTLHPDELGVKELVNSNFIIFTKNAFESFREFLGRQVISSRVELGEEPEKLVKVEALSETKRGRKTRSRGGDEDE